MKRILLSWSSGKDSAWALHLLRENLDYEVAGLLTTFNQAANRVAMHAVRRNLVEAQASAAGLDLSFVGRDVHSALLSALPPEADPCGENGEFHSFVYAGPMLSSPIPISLGDTLVRERFAFADLI